MDKHFVPIETFRPVEFTRDWNLTNLAIDENEDGGSLLLGLNKMNQQVLNYQLRTFLKGSQYRGLINALNGMFNYKTSGCFGRKLCADSGTLSKTNFLRAIGASQVLFKKVITE